MTVMLKTSPESRPVGFARPRPKQDNTSPPKNRSPRSSVFHSVDLLATSEAKITKDLDTPDGTISPTLRKEPVSSKEKKFDGRQTCSPRQIQIFNHIHPVSPTHAQNSYAMAAMLQPQLFYHPYLLMTSQLMTSQINATNIDKLSAQYASPMSQLLPKDLRKQELSEESEACEERRLMKDCEDLMPTFCKNRGKGHVCIYCGKLYSRKYGLKIHLRTHTGYKPLKCKVCQRPFGDPSNLNKHIRLHAQGDTPYRCDHCGKVLVRRRDLERHIKSRHPHAELTTSCDVIEYDVKSLEKDIDASDGLQSPYDEVDSDVENFRINRHRRTSTQNDVDEGLDPIDVENE